VKLLNYLVWFLQTAFEVCGKTTRFVFELFPNQEVGLNEEISNRLCRNIREKI
jgi:hypothetical protein